MLDTEVSLPPECGGTRCRVEVYDRGPLEPPVVVLRELDDNPGLPVTATIADLADAVRALLPEGPEPVWIEEWRGRALSALLRGHRGVTTYMRVDPAAPDGARESVHPRFLAGLRRSG